MLTVIEPRVVKLSTRTEIEVRRNLPHAQLRRVGAWVFLDHFGPTKMVEGMQVAAHPHTGLQTVTWPFQGRVEHNDSVGSRQILQPGELNLMTAGHGVAHSERSLAGTDALHAVQLWLALPRQLSDCQPSFEHHSNLPRFVHDGVSVTVFIGELAGHKSPAITHTPLVGAELAFAGRGSIELELNSTWEHAVLAVEGDIEVQGQLVQQNSLAYVAPQTSVIKIGSEKTSKVILIGGEPFSEPIFMWWNFIGRSHAEIVEMRNQWNARDGRFGEVVDSLGGWIPAPELPNVTLKPR